MRTGVAWLQIAIEVEASTRVQKAEAAEFRPPRGCQRGWRERQGVRRGKPLSAQPAASCVCVVMRRSPLVEASRNQRRSELFTGGAKLLRWASHAAVSSRNVCDGVAACAARMFRALLTIARSLGLSLR